MSASAHHEARRLTPKETLAADRRDRAAKARIGRRLQAKADAAAKAERLRKTREASDRHMDAIFAERTEPNAWHARVGHHADKVARRQERWAQLGVPQ